MHPFVLGYTEANSDLSFNVMCLHHLQRNPTVFAYLCIRLSRLLLLSCLLRPGLRGGCAGVLGIRTVANDSFQTTLTPNNQEKVYNCYSVAKREETCF